MRRALVSLGAVAAAAVAHAGDWHTAEQLRCSECHTMHHSRQHDFSYPVAGRTGFTGSDAVGDGHDALLYEADVNALCLACHDGSTTTADVLGDSSRVAFANRRAAGALQIGAGVDGRTPDTGHTLGAPVTPPGFDKVLPAGETWAELGLRCSDCHAVHGVPGGYRNVGNPHGRWEGLVAAASIQPLYTINPALNVEPSVLQPPGTGVDPSTDVTERAARDYQASHVRFGYGGGAYRMNAFCGVCHGNFHADPGTNPAPGPFKRHPTFHAFVSNSRLTRDPTTGTAAWNDAARLVKPVYRSASSGFTAPTAGTFTPGCLSCHKAHGNRNAFGLLSPTSGATSDTIDANEEDGDADETAAVAGGPLGVRNLCVNCHVQGRSPPLDVE
jgi:hypothetical protein